jgi:hypothetical protein
MSPSTRFQPGLAVVAGRLRRPILFYTPSDLSPAKRGGSGCLVSLVNVSINPGHTGGDQRSVPLGVRLLQARQRGVKGIELPFDSGTSPNMVFKGNVPDPLAGTSTPHAVMVGVSGLVAGVEHTDRWSDTMSGIARSNPIPSGPFGLFGREVEGAWTARASMASELTGIPGRLRLSVEWVSFPPP